MHPVTPPVDLRVHKCIALVMLGAGLLALVVAWQPYGGDRVPTLAHQQLGSARTWAAADNFWDFEVRVDKDAVRGEGSRRGLLRYSRSTNGAREVLPSTSVARAAAAANPGRDLLSIVLDPRDWKGEHGIYTNYEDRGRGSHRGGCLSMFAGGALRAESFVGVCIHGGRSRRHSEKSLRVMFEPEFGSRIAVSDLLPGALGRSLVVHNDRRQLPFCNPIAYEILGRLGCDVPKYRPIRLMVNGELMQRIYFLTEHYSDSYFEEKLGHRQLLINDERGGRSRIYAKLLRKIKRGRLDFVECRDLLDCDDVVRWLVGVLFCGCIDNRQGVAYLDFKDMKWRWVVWDLDWSFRPWSKTIGGKPSEYGNAVVYMREHFGDIRSTMFDCFVTEDADFRRQFLAEVSMALNHRLRPDWLRSVLGRYRKIAAEYLGPRRLRDDLDAIEQFMVQRPELLRAELVDEIGAGPVFTCKVDVPAGGEVVVDGFRYREDVTFHYFSGQEIDIQAGAGFALQVDGTEVADRVQRFVANRNLRFAVVSR